MKRFQAAIWGLLAAVLLIAQEPLMEAVRVIFADQTAVISGVWGLGKATVLAFALLGVRSWTSHSIAKNGGNPGTAQVDTRPDRRDYHALEDTLKTLDERFTSRQENTERLLLDVRDIAVETRTLAQSQSEQTARTAASLSRHITTPAATAHP